MNRLSLSLFTKQYVVRTRGVRALTTVNKETEFMKESMNKIEELFAEAKDEVTKDEKRYSHVND